MSAEDHRALLRDSIRSFLARSGNKERVRALRETRPGFERTYWQQLAELGCAGALIPSDRGGVELSLADAVALAQELGPALLPEPVTAVAVGAAGLLALVPESALARRLLPAIAHGAIIPGLAWQETGHEFPGPGTTQLMPVDEAFALTGSKRFVVPADADGYLVLANLESGLALCWVARDAAGLKLDVEWRVDGTPSGVLELGAVALDADSVAIGPMLSRQSVLAVAEHCNLCVAGELLGIAEVVLQTTLDYLRVREQFGRPIGSFQALQHRAVDLYIKQELARASLDAAVEALSRAARDHAHPIAASRAKARAADTALSVCREAVQMHGAMGFADECDIGLYLRRALVLSAWLGNATVHRRRVEHLLRESEREPSGEVTNSDAGKASTETDWDSLPDEEFRLKVRAIFEREYPPELRNPPRRLRWAECREFYRKMGELGLLALAWPRAYGGAALSTNKQLIFMQEQDRWGVARAPDMGITMVGPGLIRYGTKAQQEKFLGPIVRCEHMWCQGFSEPDAGSDLASLRTQAVFDGDELVIDGSKIWTTFAQDATHIFLLVRTDKNAKKQAGITLCLVDLATPGITVRTIRDIAGHEEFCEVHFNAVRVASDCILGQPNDGWTVAKMLLSQERIYLGNPRQAQYALKRLDDVAGELGLMNDPAFAARCTALRLDVWDLASLYGRFADQVRRGEPLGADVSIVKLFGSETYQRLSELAIESIDSCGALAGNVAFGASEVDVMSLFMNARPSTIYGGSSEVQRNVLAKQVLHLPVL